ncbi:MAG: 3-ketoacyl-ACP reductase [Pseudomonadota bacterium]
MSGVALITGGQRGIGLGIGRALADTGTSVAICAQVPPDDPQVQSALATLGPDARYFQHDMAELATIPTLLDQVEAAVGPVSTLVNNAGIGAPLRGDLLELLPENWDIVQNVNLRGPFFLAQAVAKRMLALPSEAYQSILFITSVSANLVSETRAEYCVSKAGASTVAKLFATRLAAENIGVFELRPGIIATDMTASVRDGYDARIQEGLVPARRWGEPADIGAVAVACASGQMQFATGAAIPIDGGLSIHRL